MSATGHFSLDTNNDDVKNNLSATEDEFGILSSFPTGHHVMVVHPKIRWGRHSAAASTTPELQLEEAVALVKTIPKFTVSKLVIVYFNCFLPCLIMVFLQDCP